MPYRNRNTLAPFVGRLKSRIDSALAAHLSAVIERMASIDPIGASDARVISAFVMNGGKRLRPALVAIGYTACSGRDWEEVISAAISTELFHAFFLIHDDIMDRSDLRRGAPTVHRVFQHMLGTNCTSPLSDIEHFAHSRAILAGDLCCQMAYDALLESPFPPDVILRAQRHMRMMAEATIVGQVLDMEPGEASEASVTKIQVLKTARYSVEAPLHLGMIFAGASDDDLEAMTAFARPVGIAYQLWDDWLGIYGSEQEVGKPVTSDLQERKKTLFTVFVREHGSDEQRARLATIFGKREVTEADLDQARVLFHECGAVAYSENRARSLVAEGKAALKGMHISPWGCAILSEIADFTINRNV